MDGQRIREDDRIHTNLLARAPFYRGPDRPRSQRTADRPPSAFPSNALFPIPRDLAHGRAVHMGCIME